MEFEQSYKNPLRRRIHLSLTKLSDSLFISLDTSPIFPNWQVPVLLWLSNISVNRVEPPVATTTRNLPTLNCDQFSKIPQVSFQVKSLYLELLVSDRDHF